MVSQILLSQILNGLFFSQFFFWFFDKNRSLFWLFLNILFLKQKSIGADQNKQHIGEKSWMVNTRFVKPFDRQIIRARNPIKVFSPLNMNNILGVGQTRHVSFHYITDQSFALSSALQIKTYFTNTMWWTESTQGGNIKLPNFYHGFSGFFA